MAPIFKQKAASILWKKRVSYNTEKLFFLPNTRRPVDYPVRLLRLSLAVHWSKPTVISRDNSLLIIFQYCRTPFLKNEASVFCKTESYDHVYSIIFFEKSWRKADYLFLCLDKFHWLALDLSTSSLTTTKFYAVVFFAIYWETSISLSFCCN